MNDIHNALSHFQGQITLITVHIQHVNVKGAHNDIKI
jgi:hypothetical protein